MGRMIIQFKPKQLPVPARIVLIAGGLLVAVLAIYKNTQACSMDNILIVIIGLSVFLMGFDPFSSRKPYLLINDSKIEFKIRNIGRPWVLMFNEIDSYIFDEKRLRINFNLTNYRHKTLFLRMFSKDTRTEIVKTINNILTVRTRKKDDGKG